MRVVFPLLAGVFAALMAASAAGRAASAPVPVCHDTPDYIVITRDREGEPGADIIVRRKPARPGCVFAIQLQDYMVGRGESADFLAMHGRHLALDAGTGPDRRLLIFDVAARKKLVDVPYAEGDIATPNPAGFTYWQIGEPRVSPKVCPAEWRKVNADAKSVHQTREMFFSFSDGRPRATGKVSCTQTQGDL